MRLDNRPARLNFSNPLFTKGERASEMFVPNERNASAEALICLNCPLPANKCKPNVCQRYKEEMKKIKEQHK